MRTVERFSPNDFGGLSAEVRRADSQPLTAPEIAARLRRVENLANWMDAGFRVPVLGVRFGWDSVLGLVPVVGDLLAALPSLWILTEAHRMGARRGTLLRMALNVGADVALGAVPIVGDIADVALKANRRNVGLLRRDMARNAADAGPERRTAPGGRPVLPQRSMDVEPPRAGRR